MGIDVAVQLGCLRALTPEKHDAALRGAPPGDHLRCSGQHVPRQDFGGHACAKAFRQHFKKSRRDRLTRAQIRRFVQGLDLDLRDRLPQGLEGPA